LGAINNRTPGQENFLPLRNISSISGFFFTISFLVRLFLIADGKLLPALGPSSGKDKTPTFCGHACTETKLSISLSSTWLVRSLHGEISKYVSLDADFISIAGTLSRRGSI
jgi:hypothetical protein